MNKKQFRALLAVNFTLLATLAAVTLAPGARAQRGAPRARGVYTMVAGQVQGMEESAIYIIDANNQELIALHWNQGQRALAPMGQRNMATDAKTATGGGR